MSTKQEVTSPLFLTWIPKHTALLHDKFIFTIRKVLGVAARLASSSSTAAVRRAWPLALFTNTVLAHILGFAS